MVEVFRGRKERKGTSHLLSIYYMTFIGSIICGEKKVRTKQALGHSSTYISGRGKGTCKGEEKGLAHEEGRNTGD